MADKADVAEAIARYVQEAAAALRVMQAGKPRPLTKPNHPWTNGQVERMNRTLKPAGERRSRARGERINMDAPL